MKQWFTDAKDVVIRPRRFFNKLSTSQGLKEPIIFALITFILVLVIDAIVSPFRISPDDVISWMHPTSVNPDITSIIILASLITFTFFKAFILLPANSALHFMLLKVAGANGGLEDTIKVFCYFYVISLIHYIAALIFAGIMTAAYKAGIEGTTWDMLNNFSTAIMLIPGIYGFYILFTGLSFVHKISITRVVVSVGMIPIISIFLITEFF